MTRAGFGAIKQRLIFDFAIEYSRFFRRSGAFQLSDILVGKVAESHDPSVGVPQALILFDCQQNHGVTAFAGHRDGFRFSHILNLAPVPVQFGR